MDGYQHIVGCACAFDASRFNGYRHDDVSKTWVLECLPCSLKYIDAQSTTLSIAVSATLETHSCQAASRLPCQTLVKFTLLDSKEGVFLQGINLTNCCHRLSSYQYHCATHGSFAIFLFCLLDHIVRLKLSVESIL